MPHTTTSSQPASGPLRAVIIDSDGQWAAYFGRSGGMRGSVRGGLLAPHWREDLADVEIAPDAVLIDLGDLSAVTRRQVLVRWPALDVTLPPGTIQPYGAASPTPANPHKGTFLGARWADQVALDVYVWTLKEQHTVEIIPLGPKPPVTLTAHRWPYPLATKARGA